MKYLSLVAFAASVSAGTFYKTTTEVYISTVTDPQTLTNTVSATSTFVVSTTAVTTKSITTTITRNLPRTALRKRQQTGVDSVIPAYASVCSGSVRYLSACSCLGAVPTTVTAETPSTTITVPTTVTSTETVSPTVDTKVVTLIDATVTVTQTISTRTETTVIATQSWTAFKIRATSDSPGQAGNYLYESGETVVTGVYLNRFTSNIARASVYYLNQATGVLKIAAEKEDRYFAFGNSSPSSDYAFLFNDENINYFHAIYIYTTLAGTSLSFRGGKGDNRDQLHEAAIFGSDLTTAIGTLADAPNYGRILKLAAVPL
ncbi:hypothetical protein ABW20_dc0103117 [Dactylellina cionopaga]|nr:hypothetical protein ABW20_dc0103117 [Dactylellina cionopaga]